MLRNMLDGDGQDQYDAGGWCFPKPIPPVQRNGDWIVRFATRTAAAHTPQATTPSTRAPRLAGDGANDAGEYEPGLRRELARISR
jgi:hypothetical protein